MRRALLLLLLACSSSKESRPVVTASDTPASDGRPRDAQALASDAKASDPIATDRRRWFAGDVHMHVAPPDGRDDVMLGVRAIADAAVQASMDFVVLTPHFWPARLDDKNFRDAWRAMAREARAIAKPTMIPGGEWTTRAGHFTVIGVDITKLRGRDFLEAAHAAGAFISANHPFAQPTNIPGVGASHFDLSYKVWTDRAKGFTKIDGAEVWNLPLGFANILRRPGGRTGEERAWTELDRVVREEKRRVTAVGGTDNHKTTIIATTWVLAVDATATSILQALVDGATCIGGPDAGTFRARGDAGDWVRIGQSIATKTITLLWDGTARLFIDDVDQGEHASGFVHDTGGALHTYRIAIGPSRCNFIYANLNG